MSRKEFISVGAAWGLGIVLALVLLLGAWTAHVSLSNCHSVQHLEHNAQLAGVRALRNIDSIAYYREHPTEKAQALKQIHQQIRDFTPQSCSLL